MKKALLGCVVAWALLAGFGGAQPQPDAQASGDELVRFWAPVLVQDLAQNVQYRGDYLTALDFDGSVRLDNNQSNASSYPHPSVVYSWWAETPSYSVLGYTFYRLTGADRSDNDLRSAVVLVERPTTDWPNGRFVGIAYQAGAEWQFAGEQDNVGARSPIGLRSPAGVQRDVDFASTRDAFRPVLYGELGDHDLSTEVGEEQERPLLFEQDGVTDWSGMRPMLVPANRARSTYPSGKASDYMPLDFGLVYSLGPGEGVVAQPNQRARGKLLHHWEVFSYGLRSIEPLWRLRTQAGSTEEPVFDAFGRLIGEGERGPGSLPPWLEIVQRRDAEGAWQRRLEPASIFFDGTAAFVDAFGVPGEPIVRSSIGSGATLRSARASLWNGVLPP